MIRKSPINNFDISFDVPSYTKYLPNDPEKIFGLKDFILMS